MTGTTMHARQWLAHIKYTDALLDVHALFTGQKPLIKMKKRQFDTHELNSLILTR